MKHVILLKELNLTKYSKDIVKHLADVNIDNGSEVLAAKLATKVGINKSKIHVIFPGIPKPKNLDNTSIDEAKKTFGNSKIICIYG